MKIKFVTKKNEVENVITFVFQPEQELTWQPGQYMHYVLPLENPDEKGPERWFTISSAPFERVIQLTTRFDNLPLSSFKQYLNNLKPGDEIESDGPSGKFVLSEQASRHVMIAGGIGITPFRSMLAELAHDKSPADALLLYANRDNNFIFDQELAGFAGLDQTLKIKKYVDQRISEAELKPLAETEGTMFYLSGPKGMVEAYEQQLADLGVPADNVMKDYFPGYTH